MGTWLSEREQRLVVGAETASAATPIPTQIVSNGEYLPPPQSETQKRVERRIFELAEENGKRLGLSRRQFLQTGCGMAAAFLAMNEVYGSDVFQVAAAEAHEPELMQARAQSLAGQFIFDVQTHFVRDDFDNARVLRLATFAGEHWNPKLKEAAPSLAQYKFQNYVKEVYYDSDTSLALLSGAPFDNPNWWFLSNEQIVKTRELLNEFAGSRRLLAHTIITPKQPGWVEEVDKAIEVYKPELVEGLHHRRPGRALEISVAPGRRAGDVSVLREGGEGGHHHDLHPQGPAAARLRKILRRRVGIRHGLGCRQGSQGLAADDLRHLSFRAAPIPRAARPGLGGVRVHRPYQMGKRSRRASGKIRSH